MGLGKTVGLGKQLLRIAVSWTIAVVAAVSLGESSLGQSLYGTPPGSDAWEQLGPPDQHSWLGLPDRGVPRAVPSLQTLAPRATTPVVYPAQPTPVAMPRQVQNVVDYFGAATSGRVLSQLPMRPSSGASLGYATAARHAVGTARQATARSGGKPFADSTSSSTISPYLNLFREEDPSELPNYHALVRPRLEQQASNQRSAARLARLQQKVQTVSFNATTGAGLQQNTPATGHGTRFFNTSQYYATGTAQQQ